jgi:rubrerythrin
MNFDIDRYLQLVEPLDDGDIDYDAFLTDPLDADTLRCLRYMHDIEFHTTCYLRDLLVTAAHDDPEITAFLAMWSYEEYWHGEAIAKVLARHDEAAGRERVAATRRRVGRERLNTLTMMIGSMLTDHVVTVALTWGALNEWTTQAGYLQLAKRSGHPVLGELLRRIAKQEGRHIDFYASRAARGLERSRAARRLTRLALRRSWRPVGSGVMPQRETDHLIGHLFGGDDGASMAQRIDRRLSRLPGLDALGLVTSARNRTVAVAA